MNAIELAVFTGRLNAICEEMGYVLQRTAISPNIKDRLDFSCAVFDSKGHICAQAAHIPVHLGSMAYAMVNIVSEFDWIEDDVLVMNDPFKGGTHLPDVTLVKPFFIKGEHLGFVACRAHHANIGAVSAGSMPLSSSLEEEGVVISPIKLYEAGELNPKARQILSSIDGSDGDIPADFLAQNSALLQGCKALSAWLESVERGYFLSGVNAINAYGQRLAKEYISSIDNGVSEFFDFLDGDGFDNEKIKINIRLTKQADSLVVDFSGSGFQVRGNLNCPISVTAASVYYVIVCMLPSYTPCCQSVFDLIKIKAQSSTIVNAGPGAAVAAGNVETSMRIVDVMIGALGKLGVDIPAASQGTMNNVAMGSRRGIREIARQEKELSGKDRGEFSSVWDYYETIGGGSGASAKHRGLDGRQAHMTNTLNTPVESIEMHYPLRIVNYGLRERTGGSGLNNGGNGVERSYLFLEDAEFTLLTERRTIPPWGLSGGGAGVVGNNLLNGNRIPGKIQLTSEKGDILTICTPGGGGYGE